MHEEKREAFEQIRRLRQWVLQAEHILDGSWAKEAHELTNAEVGRRFDGYLSELAQFVAADVRTEEERQRLGHLLKVLTHLRPGLIHCYDLPGFPRTNNDMERTIRSVKMHYRRISGRKNWNNYLLRYGRCVVYHEWWSQQTNGKQLLNKRMSQVSPRDFRRVRQQTRESHREQLLRYRFAHYPQASLASLEQRWHTASCTRVLPP